MPDFFYFIKKVTWSIFWPISIYETREKIINLGLNSVKINGCGYGAVCAVAPQSPEFMMKITCYNFLSNIACKTFCQQASKKILKN